MIRQVNLPISRVNNQLVPDSKIPELVREELEKASRIGSPPSPFLLDTFDQGVKKLQEASDPRLPLDVLDQAVEKAVQKLREASQERPTTSQFFLDGLDGPVEEIIQSIPYRMDPKPRYGDNVWFWHVGKRGNLEITQRFVDFGRNRIRLTSQFPYFRYQLTRDSFQHGSPSASYAYAHTMHWEKISYPVGLEASRKVPDELAQEIYAQNPELQGILLTGLDKIEADSSKNNFFQSLLRKSFREVHSKPSERERTFADENDLSFVGSIRLERIQQVQIYSKGDPKKTKEEPISEGHVRIITYCPNPDPRYEHVKLTNELHAAWPGTDYERITNSLYYTILHQSTSKDSSTHSAPFNPVFNQLATLLRQSGKTPRG